MANAIVVLKGAYTRVITPGGLVYFNSTGNAGMAKGGSGDALSGYIAGWLAQGMQPIAASLLGVYVHGLAGDLAAKQHGQVPFTISQLIQTIPKAFQQVSNAGALEQTEIYKK
jgi:NAD(P)H-hydrate epimerase